MKVFLFIPLLLLVNIACTSNIDNANTANHEAEIKTEANNSENTPFTDQFSNQLWQAEDVLGLGIPDYANITLQVKNNRVSGLAGCNNYSGQFEQEKNRLTFSHMVVTMKACVPAIADIENKFLQVLEQTESFVIDNHGMLILHNQNHQPLASFSAKSNVFQTITGSVTYKERIALPPNSILAVKLYDVSLMDVPAILIAKTDIALNVNNGQQVPFDFKINYLSEKIDPRHTYSVQAKITTNEKLAFISTTTNPVITRGNSQHVDIMLTWVNQKKTLSLVKYTCTRNTNLSVSFTQNSRNNHKENMAVINGFGKQAIILPSQPVASGFFYSNGKYSLRGKGEQATWTVGKMMPMQCKVAGSLKAPESLL